METGLSNVLKIAGDLGLVALVIYMWWTDTKRLSVVMEQGRKDLSLAMDQGRKDLAFAMDQGRKDLATVIEKDAKNFAALMFRYEKDMNEQRDMYKANASLCRDFTSIATDLRDIVTLNIQTMTRVDEGVRQNQFCPMVRIRSKKSIGEIPEERG